MGHSLDPAVQRRRLRIGLQRARTQAKLTQKEVADELGWSLTKLIRIENGKVSISKNDLNGLLRYYGITDPGIIRNFQQMAQASRRQPWSEYRGVLNPDFMAYLAYEGSASVIQQFHPMLVPGLLQAEPYARRLIWSLADGTSDEVLERQTEARLRRQGLLDRDDPPRLSFVIDEAVIPRGFSKDPEDLAIMRGQIEHLKDLNTRPYIDIQILPFKSGAHVGLNGPFVILEFPDAEDPDLLYLENVHKSVATRDDESRIASYRESFKELERLSMSGPDVIRFLDDAAARFS